VGFAKIVQNLPYFEQSVAYVTAIELILCVVASVCMFEVFFLHFSEITLQALLISATSKFLQCTRDTSTVKDTSKETSKETSNDTLNVKLKDSSNDTSKETSKDTFKDTPKDTLKVTLNDSLKYRL
jgi:hypothetical protein